MFLTEPLRGCLGASLAGVSDIYTIGVRVLSGTGDAIGGLAFIDLTD